MDWIDEKAEKLFTYIRNLSFRKAMISYVVMLTGLVWLLSYITRAFCRYQNIPFIGEWCAFVYFFAGILITIFLFYYKRLKKPLSILEKSVKRIQENDLDFHISYDSQDEFGSLCDSVEAMRLELIKNKEELWRLVERQKDLNAAFAHDLRTPLTVLRGYTDFLAKYIPEGKLSQKKLQDTLQLMTEHLKRLEDYSRTMKGIRSIEDLPISCQKIWLSGIENRIKEIVFALNQTGGIQIVYEGFHLDTQVSVDENIIMEVLDNTLSNAIRYARSKIEILTDYTPANGPDPSEKGELLLTVRDDGPGFSKDQLKLATKPYHSEYRADPDDEHFGIGLHICLELCKKHGGTLNAANSIMGGAVITATFFSQINAKENI